MERIRNRAPAYRDVCLVCTAWLGMRGQLIESGVEWLWARGAGRCCTELEMFS